MVSINLQIKIVGKFLIFVFAIFYSSFVIGQVGINTDKPNDKTLLHISERMDPMSPNPSQYKGIIIPRYTQSERDLNVTTQMDDAENSLLIYNTTDNCYNYWNKIEKKWKSICGSIGKSRFTVDCSSIKVNGSYIQNKTLETTNSISIPVTVSEPGEYVIMITTMNGYNFFASGTFLENGSYSIIANGQGVPANVQTDNLSININGEKVVCLPSKTITVISAPGSYTMNCRTANANGVYKLGTALAANNTIALSINVYNIGSYTITSDRVDGISFSGSGVFTTIGTQNIILFGSGTPLSTRDKLLTLTSDTEGAFSKSCNVTVSIVSPNKKVLHIGNETAYGYSAFTGPARSLMDASTNFGTNAQSKFKIEGFTHTSINANPSDSALLNALNSKPDIVIIGFDNFSLTATQSSYLVNYLNKKGVIIAFQDRIDSNVSLNFMRSVFSNPSLTISYVGGGPGAVYPLTNVDDPILNGPFGDVRGKNWGEDASTTIAITSNISGVIPYSYAQPINNATVYTGITGFRHSNLNLVWFGDGGFISNELAIGNQYPSFIIEPFVAPSSNGYLPMPKTSYGFAGNGYAAGSMQVHNAIVFANMLAWAIKQSESNGINTP